ncbi:MAG: ATP-dependent DNA helicase RecG [Actinobacteria bacterium]|nr:ATP-dependent DNA helicase RecG [Actinomycetota bacterium]
MSLAKIPVDVLKGVGEKYSDSLATVGIYSVLDLLTCYPYRYEDRRQVAEIDTMVPGNSAWLRVRVMDIDSRRLRNGRTVVNIVAGDGSGTLKVVFFNQPWRARQLRQGSHIWIFGELAIHRNSVQMVNPIVDTSPELPQLGLIPVYPASEKASITSSDIMRFVEEALNRAGELADPLDNATRQRLELWDRTTAFRKIHRPVDPREVVLARRRLAFDELLWLQIHLAMADNRRKRFSIGIRHDITGIDGGGIGDREGIDEHDFIDHGVVGSALDVGNGGSGIVGDGTLDTSGNDADNSAGNSAGIERDKIVDGKGDIGADSSIVSSFLRALPFELTESQLNALYDIAKDMSGSLPMHRLLQGDVGSGKTVVAAAAMLIGVQGGYQAALMAPTEVLAEQHLISLRSLMGEILVYDDGAIGGMRPFEIQLLTGRMPATHRRRILNDIAEGRVDIVVGTHALLGQAVSFNNLGVVVVDEQHRFGVEQRLSIRGKGVDSGSHDPDVLVMTATPIPRTAALAIFGDLDQTVMNEMPKGRRPVRTIWVKEAQDEARVWERVRSEVDAGHNVYVVCPLIDDNERLEATSTAQELDKLATGPLSGVDIGVMHGQLPANTKAEIMQRFKAGDVRVLVSTTVIEVGVDVPNATVMVIESAERFGLSQLHQLRGRVGRSDLPAWCYAIGKPTTKDGERRLEAFASTTDGFELAEMDMDIRGEGAILGTRQAGRSGFKLATLRRVDREFVEMARLVAVDLVSRDPELAMNNLLRDEVDMFISGAAHYLVSG